MLLAAKETRLFGICEKILDKWIQATRKNQKITNKVDCKKAYISMSVGAFEILYSGIIMYICAMSVVHGNIQIGEFFIYTANYTLLFTAISEIMSSIRSSIQTSSEYDDFIKFSTISAEQRGGREDITKKKISIRFDNVSFKYNDKMVLQNVSFEWNEGENIALIGKNGSGKSTLIKLLCGLYECDEGCIYINGINVKEYSQPALYKLFGVVYQDFCHYQLKLRDIIAAQNLSEKDNDKDLWLAFQMAGGDDFKYILSNGMDTPLGREYDKDGVELSGGQWQKIAIARNYFGKRRFKIFDEPASALDVMSEQKIVENILDCGIENESNLIISHRLSIGLLVDKILYLENGRLVEQGTHDELIHSNGRYAEMFKLQSDKYM